MSQDTGKKSAVKKIGITIFPSKTGFSFWSNGAHQNCAFLFLGLRAAGHDVRLINGGDGTPPTPECLPPELRDIVWHPLTDETVSDLDLLIQAGAQVSAEHIALVHEHGGKAVSYKFGADFPIDAERAIHNLPAGAIFNGARFDEIWTTAQHTEVCGAYWEIMHRCPVRVLPHIWHPCFVDQIVRELPAGLEGFYTEERARRPKKRIAILEPNINLIKTAHIPIVICEQAFRQRPDLIENVFVLNADRATLKNHLSFNTMLARLDLQNTMAEDGRPVISCEPRFNTPWFMAAHGDIVVSHQWITAANYSHYDLLYLGYPLVHNVPEMLNWGVSGYYSGFGAKDGAKRLLDILTGRQPFENRHLGRTFVESRRADRPGNVEDHARAVERLFI